MILFPAIDILNGKAVRLYRGDKNAVTEYGDPIEFAEKWVEAGAEWLHVVDLAGAFSGESGIDGILTEIKKRFHVRVQSGGGLRTVDDVRRRLDAGADRVVLGTMAALHPDDFALATFQFPEKIVAGIDAKDGRFAVQGWTESSAWSAEELIGRFLARGLRQVICTDISRDGMLCGPATGLYAALQQRFPDVEITVSGGVSAWRDLETLERAGLRSAIVGKAIYEGRITLKELKRCLQNE